MRARKAYKISRVLLRLVDDSPDVSVDHLVDATEEFRLRIAALAKTREPSEKTWSIAVDLVRTELGLRSALPDPFGG